MSTPTSYVSQRDRMNARIATDAPSQVPSGFAAAADRLDAFDFAPRAPQVGDRAPDFVLPDQRGEEVYLSALLRNGPVVLIFYRGEWCPYCNLQLRIYPAHLDQIATLGAQLVAVSPQTPDHSLSMAEKNDLGFLVLSEVGANVIDRYGLNYEVVLYRVIELWIPAVLGIAAFVQLRLLLRRESEAIELCKQGDTIEIIGLRPTTIERARTKSTVSAVRAPAA